MTPFDRVMNALPSWVYLGAGLLVLAAAVLVPAWAELAQLNWQRQTMAADLAVYREQAAVYRGVDDALKRGDPEVIDRLARRQFNLVAPGDVHLIRATPAAAGTSATAGVVDPMGRAAAIDGIDAMLARALPAPPPAPDRHPVFRSHLVRLATGEHRMGLVVVGGIFVFVGLWRQPGAADKRSLADRLRDTAEAA